MSVFHGVDRLGALPADVFVSRLQRLRMYDGAVRAAWRDDVAAAPAPAAQPRRALPAAQEPPGPPEVTPYTGEQLAAMAQSVEWGPNPGLNQLAPMIEYG